MPDILLGLVSAWPVLLAFLLILAWERLVSGFLPKQ